LQELKKGIDLITLGLVDFELQNTILKKKNEIGEITQSINKLLTIL
jgi:hypothetical protein